jgi:hypothetical protein
VRSAHGLVRLPDEDILSSRLAGDALRLTDSHDRVECEHFLRRAVDSSRQLAAAQYSLELCRGERVGRYCGLLVLVLDGQCADAAIVAQLMEDLVTDLRGQGEKVGAIKVQLPGGDKMVIECTLQCDA